MTDQPPVPPVSTPAMATGPDLSTIKIPLLVSGICNAIAALTLGIAGIVLLLAVIGCFFLPFAIGAGVLAWFEIRTYLELNEPGDHSHLEKRVQLLAILEICTIVFSNWPSVACGIITLVNIKKMSPNRV